MDCVTSELNPLLNYLVPLLGIIDEVLEDSSSSSSDENDEEETGCVSFMVTLDKYNEKTFKSHMRLQKTTVEYLIVRYKESETFLTQRNVGRAKIRPKQMVYMYIWYVSNTITFRQLANLFGVSKSCAWEVVRRIASWLIEIGEEFVKWPTGSALENTAKKFIERKKIAGAIGAIDGTHIKINAPKEQKEAYFNRKQTYSIILQAVVDADKKFINIYCGEPGSLHDSRVLRKSELYHRAETNQSTLFPNATFLLGDSAYSNTSWLVTPFRDNGNLTAQQKKFNQMHSAARIVVENAFGLWKGRFRRMLKFTENRDLKSVTNLIISTCVLHNICILKEDNLDMEENQPTEDTENYLESIEERNVVNGENRRNILFNSMIQQNSLR